MWPIINFKEILLINTKHNYKNKDIRNDFIKYEPMKDIHC